MQSFSHRILSWYDLHGRTSLPWQNPITPYRVWISEVMLQQTQVKTAIPYFLNFIEKFPSINVLATVHEDEVMNAWAGLGYYSRARNLHKAARIINYQYKGDFPIHYESIVALPGIGRSTAGAILSISMNKPYPILDGNVKRVLSRHQLIEGEPNTTKILKEQWAVAERLMPKRRFGDYSQAMMDLGSIVCTRINPSCNNCPVRLDCLARIEDKVGEFPHKKNKKKLPSKSIFMLIITDGKSIFLEKRPKKGIWGGLWSFPEVNQKPSDYSLFTDDEIKKVDEWDKFIHVFTHYRLEIHPIMICVDKLSKGFSFNEIKHKGMPKPILDLINQLNN